MCRRMDELRRSEQRATVEELMYVSVLEKFLSLGVNMMPRLETVVETPGNIKARYWLDKCNSLYHRQYEVKRSSDGAARTVTTTST